MISGNEMVLSPRNALEAPNRPCRIFSAGPLIGSRMSVNSAATIVTEKICGMNTSARYRLNSRPRRFSSSARPRPMTICNTVTPTAYVSVTFKLSQVCELRLVNACR